MAVVKVRLERTAGVKLMTAEYCQYFENNFLLRVIPHTDIESETYMEMRALGVYQLESYFRINGIMLTV